MNKEKLNDRRILIAILFYLLFLYLVYQLGVYLNMVWHYLLMHKLPILWCATFSSLGIAFYNWIRREDKDTKGYWYYIFYFFIFQFPLSLAAAYGAYLSFDKYDDARKLIFSALTALMVALYGEKISGDPLKVKVS